MSDPRLDGLPDEVIKNASEAHCVRCGEQIIAQPSVTGTVMVNYYVPAQGVRERQFLCGLCGIAFQEFLRPSLLTNEAFQDMKVELQGRWLS